MEYIKKCLNCGEEFTSNRKDKLYCDFECARSMQQKRYWRRKRSEIAAKLPTCFVKISEFDLENIMDQIKFLKQMLLFQAQHLNEETEKQQIKQLNFFINNCNAILDLTESINCLKHS